MEKIAAFVCGLLFGVGLMISGMSQPAKVLAFLDVAGDWDPSLALVMVAALAVSALGFAFAKERKPLFAPRSLWPGTAGIDARLISGAVLFGLGWGLAGLCPGPAIVNLAALSPQVIVFVLAMIAGMAAHDFWQRQQAQRRAATAGVDG